MKKKQIEKPKRSKIEYPKEVEAAWYVLKNFINTLDCSQKIGGDVYPFNKNWKLACLFSGTESWDEENRYTYFSKARLSEHLFGLSNYYYRSDYKGIYKTGYGSNDQQAQKLSFSKELGVNHKVMKYEGLCIILLGIDIDTHKGEKDHDKVEQWLKQNYFPETYWEPSTHLKGRHGYLKLAYPEDTSLNYVISTIKELFSLLDKKRELMGFEAPLDKPCGLPTTLSVVDHNPYPDIPLNKTAGGYIRINRSQAFKVPRFNRTDRYYCSLEDISYFHNLRFYSFEYLEDHLKSLRKEIILPEKEDVIKTNQDSLTIVRSPLCNADPQTTVENEEMDLSDYWQNKKGADNAGNSDIYDQRIEECRGMNDTMEKTRKFYWYYCLYRKEVPSVEDAIAEYISKGLNTSSDTGSSKRRSRFKSCRKFISARFDVSKLRFDLDDWDVEKERYIGFVSKYLKNTELSWSKGDKRKMKMQVEEIALIYYAIRKSNDYDRGNADKLIKSSFSYRSIQKAFKAVFDKSCHRAKASRILRILSGVGLIVKVGNYIPGVRGNCYVTSELYEHFDKPVTSDVWMSEMSVGDFLESLGIGQNEQIRLTA